MGLTLLEVITAQSYSLFVNLMEYSSISTSLKIVEPRSLGQKAWFDADRAGSSPFVDGNAYHLLSLNHRYWQIEDHRGQCYGCLSAQDYFEPSVSSMP